MQASPRTGPRFWSWNAPAKDTLADADSPSMTKATGPLNRLALGRFLFGNEGIGKVRGGIGKVIPEQLHPVGLPAWIAPEVDHQGPTMFSHAFKAQTEPPLKISP